MANIIVNLNHPIHDGMPLTFRAACHCNEIEGLVVNYVEVSEDSSTAASKTFVFKDAQGNILTGLGNLFSKGAYVRVLLDTENGFAYIQNATTNGYLEKRLADVKAEYGTATMNTIGTGNVILVWNAPDGWEPKTGAKISMKTPCASDKVISVAVKAVEYSLVDALGRNLASAGATLFASGVMVEMMLDCENQKAYLIGGGGSGGGSGAAGADGVGIASVVQTTTSTEDAGTNVITVTLTDGKKSTFYVKNGSNGSAGKDGQSGRDGEDGNGIKSAILNADYTLTLTFDDGTTYTTPSIRGAAGSNGKDGAAGKDGASITVTNVSQSSADSGSNVVTFSDGTTVTIKNGGKGSTGAAGKDGKDYSFDPTVYRLPILSFTGSMEGMTKENAVTLNYECNDKNGTKKTGTCTLKWQGSSSLAWDKKNYTVKFDNAFEVVDGWGSQNKYCLKANWIDHSHSRNVVCAKLWGLLRKNRSDLNSKLKSLPNAGAIDGFPVIIMHNGEFHGLYSFNIPKDGWMFGMGSGTKEAIVGADNQADDTAFKAETLLDADGWELEYNSDTFSATEVKDSLNNLIRACINTTGSDLDTTVAQYLDWQSAIDYYIFAVIIKGGDMITKNTMLATFDGVKWYFSAYDMDTTFGLAFDGSALDRAVSNVNFEEIAGSHRVFELIKRFKTDELKARYKELRANALSETRICQYFENYAWDISSPILVEEVKRWPSVRGSSVNGIDQICRWLRQRLEVADAWANTLPAQETPVEPEQPVELKNWVEYAEDTAAGSLYNGCGYKDNARLSSSGGVSGSAQENSVVVGFMPFKNTDVIRMKGAEWLGATAKYQGHYYFSLYDSSKSFIPDAWVSSESFAGGTLSSQISVTYDETTGVTTFQIIDLTGTAGGFSKSAKSASYFRINAYGKGADLIITINQEITD